jgi:uncharacterized protein YlxW (UPF0749 family)
MDSSRSGVLIAAGLLLVSSFGMGVLGASAVVDRIEDSRAREAAALDQELDQVQDDLDDANVRIRELEAEVKLIRAAHEDPD